MREFFTIAIFKIKADIRMNKTTLNSQKEKHSILSLRRATSVALPGLRLHLNFYPRSPCGERRILSDMANAVFEFLSTLSLRRATGIADAVALALDISIHALLAESDTSIRCSLNHYLAFLSTLSLRRATISPTGAGAPPHNFYPRSPCGERLYGFRLMMAVFLFLSTLSLRRATLSIFTLPPFVRISIHALLVESDGKNKNTAESQKISIHALLAESDQGRGARHKRETISIHALLAESDFMLESNAPTPTVFLSTLSLRRATRAIIVFGCTFRFLSTLSLRRATISHFQTLT